MQMIVQWGNRFDSGALCLYEFVLMMTLGVETFKMKSYLRQTMLHSAPESERITPQSSGTVFCCNCLLS